MSKAFDTISIYTLIRKLLQTNIPGTLIKFIANCIKGRKAYTTYINHTSSQRQFTRWRPFTNTIQHIHCRHTTTMSPTIQSTGSGHGLSPSHLHTQAGVQLRNTCNHTYSDQKVFAWTKQNNLTLSQYETTSTLCTPDPA